MDKNKKTAFFLILFVAVVGLVAYSYSAEPVKKQASGEVCPDCGKVHGDEGAEEAGGSETVLEGQISQINPTTAKSLKVQLQELDSENCANDVANALAALGSIGKIRCDLTTKQFEVEYDSAVLNEAKILGVFNKVGHPGKPITGS
jgi:copper chaperone CopZ